MTNSVAASFPRDFGNMQFQSLFDKIFTVRGTVDVTSLADGVGANEDVTVTGVKLGVAGSNKLTDMVIARSFGVSVAGITITADVIADNTVRLRFQNESGGTLDLASTNFALVIGRPSANLWGTNPHLG